jgi:hypothetical protein
MLTEAEGLLCARMDRARLYQEVDHLRAENNRLAGMIDLFIEEIEAVYPEGPAGEIAFHHDWPDLCRVYERAKTLLVGACQ